MLIRAERAFLDPAGIPNRPWYRHLLYAPKPTYAAEVLPGVTEAIEAGDRPLDERRWRAWPPRSIARAHVCADQAGELRHESPANGA